MMHSTSGHKPGTETALSKMTVLATKPMFGTGKRDGYKHSGEGKGMLPAQEDGQYWQLNFINPSQPSPQANRN